MRVDIPPDKATPPRLHRATLMVIGLVVALVRSVAVAGPAGAVDPPTISIEGIEVVEGDGGEVEANFEVVLSEPAAVDVTVDFATEDGEATAPLDYEATEGTITFAPGGTSETISVPVKGDVRDEEDEDFLVELSNAVGADIEVSLGVGVIVGDDQTLEIEDTSVIEGDSGTVEATLSVLLSTVSSRHVTVDFETVDGSARNHGDYEGESGTLTFSPGELSETITVEVKGDTLSEGGDNGGEEFSVRLKNASHADIADPLGVVTILDDDVTIKIEDAAVAEPDSGSTEAVFAVLLSAPPSGHVEVDFRTVEGTATAGEDFVPTSGTLTFSPGEASKSIEVTVKSDEVGREGLDDEGEELFYVELFDPEGAEFEDSVGEGKIVDADTVIEIGDSEVSEDTDQALLEVRLNRVVDETVKVRFTTRDGSATSPEDYSSESGTITFEPGEGSKHIVVDIKDDRLAEPDEIFFVELSSPSNAELLDGQAEVILVDNDGLLAIEDVIVTEGDSRRGFNASFFVALSTPSPDVVTVDWDTVDGTATAPEDYEEAEGTLTFAPGQVSRTIDVRIVNDEIDEGAAEPEIFFVELTNPSGGARVADPRAEAEIIDDDLAITIEDADVAEEDEGDVDATFTLRLSSESPRTVEVDYTTRDGSAMAGEDYEATSDTVVFPPFEVEAEITVPVFGDREDEPEETFFVELSEPVNAELADDEAEATIAASDRGYWMAGSDGGIFTFGDADFLGSTGGIPLNQPIVGMAPTPNGNGYWLVAADGGIFAFGDAPFLGSTGGMRLNRPIVGMAATPSGNGYWLVAADGGIFTFGEARFHGSTGGNRLNRPIVGMAATPSGNGYWLVASDGGIFTFGDARFHGSTGHVGLSRPVLGMAATASGLGYWLVAQDGGIFTFGDAAFMGSTGGMRLNRPIVAMAATPTGDGYWLVASDGGAFAFGGADFMGSTGDIKLNRPIVATAALPAERRRPPL